MVESATTLTVGPRHDPKRTYWTRHVPLRVTPASRPAETSQPHLFSSARLACPRFFPHSSLSSTFLLQPLESFLYITPLDKQGAPYHFTSLSHRHQLISSRPSSIMSSALHTTAPKANDLSKRRRFQPPITSFFNNSSDSTADCDARVSHNHYSARTYSPTPTVPATVQSSLLSVGMRVRKSVADGYRTHGSKLDEKTTFPSYNPTVLHRTSDAQTELSPFCGMPKTGDSVTQPHSMPAPGIDYNHHQLITDDGDAFSLPSSSQESAASYSTRPTVQKRSFETDYADDCDDESDSSTTLPAGWQNMAPTVGRTILAPKLGQRRQFVAMQEQKAMDMDDFDEPSFLRRREEVDTEYVPGGASGYEIQMGGV